MQKKFAVEMVGKIPESFAILRIKAEEIKFDRSKRIWLSENGNL